MSGIQFVVDEKPFICWDPNLATKNLEFLQGIDSRYFEYVVESNIEHLDGDNKHRAALSIRLAYSQALETLFALLGALIQAPNCPLGWMLAYRTEVHSFVRKMSGGENVLSRHKLAFTWETLATGIHSRLACDEDKKKWIGDGFGTSWSRFASDFLNPHFNAEYNSMKHGLRCGLGGFTLAAGIEETPGVPAPDDAMTFIGGSIFGTSFFEKKSIGSAAGFNFRPRRCNRNWSPENMMHAVAVAAMSINNVVCALRILNSDDPTKCEFRHPESPDYFDQPWAKRVPVVEMNMDTEVFDTQIPQTTKVEVVASYAVSGQCGMPPTTPEEQ